MGFTFALLLILALVAAVTFAILLAGAFLRKRPTKIWIVRLGISAAFVVVGFIGILNFARSRDIATASRSNNAPAQRNGSGPSD